MAEIAFSSNVDSWLAEPGHLSRDGLSARAFNEVAAYLDGLRTSGGRRSRGVPIADWGNGLRSLRIDTGTRGRRGFTGSVFFYVDSASRILLLRSEAHPTTDPPAAAIARARADMERCRSNGDRIEEL